MKKLISLMCSLMLVCASVSLFPVNAETKTGNTSNTSVSSVGAYFEYTQYADHAELTGIKEEAPISIFYSAIRIPSEVDGLPVTSIGDNVFALSPLVAIVLPDTITSIGDSAFARCSLTSITLGENVQRIDRYAFGGCGLETVIIKNSNCEIYDSMDTFSIRIDSTHYPMTGTIYGYEGSTAQAYAQKYGIKFQALSSSTASQPVQTNSAAVWNEINPDMNRDGTLDSKDAALVLVYAAEFGAGNVRNFSEFMDKQYPNG